MSWAAIILVIAVLLIIALAMILATCGNAPVSFLACAIGAAILILIIGFFMYLVSVVPHAIREVLVSFTFIIVIVVVILGLVLISCIQRMGAIQAPGNQAPGDQAPGIQAPGNQAPGIQAPGDQAPGDQAPGDQAPGIQAPAIPAPVALAPDNLLALMERIENERMDDEHLGLHRRFIMYN